MAADAGLQFGLFRVSLGRLQRSREKAKKVGKHLPGHQYASKSGAFDLFVESELVMTADSGSNSGSGRVS